MVDQPDNLVLVQLRETRAENARRFDEIAIEVAELRDEMRGTRTALTGVGHLVNLSAGDLNTEIEKLGERIDRLERESA